MNLAMQNGPSLAGQSPAPAPPTASGTAAPGTAPAAAPAADAGMFWIFIPLILAMFLFSAMSSRKQRKQKEKMLGDLKKHDRVVTTGGMIGWVAEVKPDLVVLRVEQGQDVRISFTRDAIAAVLKASSAEGASESQNA
jgi:preprotein translocase subunit YajC